MSSRHLHARIDTEAHRVCAKQHIVELCYGMIAGVREQRYIPDQRDRCQFCQNRLKANSILERTGSERKPRIAAPDEAEYFQGSQPRKVLLSLTQKDTYINSAGISGLIE